MEKEFKVYIGSSLDEDAVKMLVGMFNSKSRAIDQVNAIIDNYPPSMNNDTEQYVKISIRNMS